MPLFRSYAKFKLAQKAFRMGRDALAARNGKQVKGRGRGAKGKRRVAARR